MNSKADAVAMRLRGDLAMVDHFHRSVHEEDAGRLEELPCGQNNNNSSNEMDRQGRTLEGIFADP